MKTERLNVETSGPTARVTLDRADARNALDRAMIRDLVEAFGLLAKDADVRCVVLDGAGPAFCAGADVDWMRASLELSAEENRADARALAEALRAVDECPKPVIGRVHGAAMGGGSGLVAVCDLVVAAEDSRFAFSEAKLGLVPGVISAFVVPKIGLSQARRYFVTAEVFGAARAREIGLVHEVVAADRLDATVAEWAKAIANNGPRAMAEAKALLRRSQGLGRDQALELGVDTIARLRTSPEAQEGLRAFLEKRPPGWAPK
jgi:methylglutaconyl-CoA hydratase